MSAPPLVYLRTSGDKNQRELHALFSGSLLRKMCLTVPRLPVIREYVDVLTGKIMRELANPRTRLSNTRSASVSVTAEALRALDENESRTVRLLAT